MEGICLIHNNWHKAGSSLRGSFPIHRCQLYKGDPVVVNEEVHGLLFFYILVLEEQKDILFTGAARLGVVQSKLLHTRGMPGAVVMAIGLELGTAVQKGTLHPTGSWHSAMQGDQI